MPAKKMHGYHEMMYRVLKVQFLTRKAVKLQAKRKKIGGKTHHMPRPEEQNACHSFRIALLQSITKIGTEISTMKCNKKTLHKFSPHIPPKTSKGIMSKSTNGMMQADITVRTQ
jgi:hypothetical protein